MKNFIRKNKNHNYNRFFKGFININFLKKPKNKLDYI